MDIEPERLDLEISESRCPVFEKEIRVVIHDSWVITDKFELEYFEMLRGLLQ